jgi:hypothetical protein
MKRKRVWWLIAAMLVAAVVIMALPRKSGPRPQMEFSFLAYSNLPAGPAAAFAVYFPPRFGGCGWRGQEVDSLEGGVWKTNPEPRAASMQFVSSGRARSTNGRPINFIMLLPVANTNEAWRFRVRVDEQPPSPPFLVKLGRELWRRMQRVSAQSPVRSDIDRSYWLTNEVRPFAPPGGHGRNNGEGFTAGVKAGNGSGFFSARSHSR